jgi:hypothetical protein
MQPSVLSARAKMWPLTHWNDGPSRRPLPVRAAFMQRTRTDRLERPPCNRGTRAAVLVLDRRTSQIWRCPDHESFDVPKPPH